MESADLIEFKFTKEQVKAFRHIVDADYINNEILLFLNDPLLPDEEIDNIFAVIYDVIDKAGELEKKRK